MKEKIFVYGAGGHAKVVMDIIERQGLYVVGGLIDDNPHLKGTEVYGYPVIGGRDELLKQYCQFTAGIIAIGCNRIRATVASVLAQNGFRFVTAVHPSTQIAKGVTIGAGTAVMAGAVINSDASIGNHVIVNSRVSVDHDCVIGNGVHLAPAATLCGGVTVGVESFICAGVTVIPDRTIGKYVVAGAGSTIIRDVPDQVTVAGSPARIIRQN